MTDPINSRFLELPGGLHAELVATSTQMFYDPTTQKARATFQGQAFIQAGDSWLLLGDGRFDVLQVELENILHECLATGVTDPVTGADLGQVSGYGILLFMKKTYDVLHNRRAAELAAAAEEEPPVEEPPPEEPPPEEGE